MKAARLEIYRTLKKSLHCSIVSFKDGLKNMNAHYIDKLCKINQVHTIRVGEGKFDEIIVDSNHIVFH